MAWIKLNATTPAAPSGAQNVHFRTDSTHLGTEADPLSVSAYLSPFTGDSGSGGASGLVPAPASGDANAGKYLKAGGSFETLVLATTSAAGAVKPDGITIEVASDGTISGITPMVVGFVIGSGAVGTNVGPMLFAPRAGSLSKCIVIVKASDSSTALTFCIKKNNTDIFSTDPTIAADTASGTVLPFTTLTSTPLAVASGDVLTIDITSGSANWSFTAQLE